MKFLSLYCGLAATLFVAPAMAQDVVLDTFEGYASTTEMKVVWPSSTGFPTWTLGTTGGADGTTNFLNLEDGGFGMSVTGTGFAAAPTAGAHTLSFSYKNGIDGGEAMSALRVELVQDASVKATVTLGDAAAATWTPAASTAVVLTGSPITIVVKADNGPAAVHRAHFDQFVLKPVANVPLELTVYPDDRIYLSGSETIVASPRFGAEPYTKVDFDVNNDGSVEFSDTSAPYEFAWNTLTHVPDGTSRTLNTLPVNTPIPVKITVTDSSANTASVIEDYTVDNELGGRESLIVNSDFSQWQGTGFGSNLPVGWMENWTSGTLPQYGIAPGRNVAAGDALQITFTNPTTEVGLFSDRYALRSNPQLGRYRDNQVTFWGKGAYCALYFLRSSDGITFETTLVHAGIANSENWTFVVSPVRTVGALGLTDTTHVALGTHQLGVTPHFWDDVTWDANHIPAGTGVNEWNLY